MQGKGLLEADIAFRDDEKDKTFRLSSIAIADKIKENLPPHAPAEPGIVAPPALSKALIASPDDRAAAAAYAAELADAAQCVQHRRMA
jgi:hypothetical protein